MGVWIETKLTLFGWLVIRVTPCMGVWIETTVRCVNLLRLYSHTLYGCVD